MKRILAFLLVLVVTISVSGLFAVPGVLAAENLITDGGFETYNSDDQLFSTGSYWNKRSQCTAVVTNAEKRSGSNSVLMTPIASTTSGGVEGISTSTKVGITQADDEWYLLEAYLKPDSQTPDANLKGKMGGSL